MLPCELELGRCRLAIFMNAFEGQKGKGQNYGCKEVFGHGSAVSFWHLILVMFLSFVK